MVNRAVVGEHSLFYPVNDIRGPIHLLAVKFASDPLLDPDRTDSLPLPMSHSRYAPVLRRRRLWATPVAGPHIELTVLGV